MEPTPAQPKAEAGAAQKRCLPGWWLHGEAGKPCWNQRLCSSGPRAGRLRQKGRPLHGKAGNPAGTSASAAQRRGRGGVKVSDLNRGPTYGNRLGPARESWKTLLEPAPRQHRAEGGAALRSAALTADRRTGTGWGLHGKAGKPCWNQHLGSQTIIPVGFAAGLNDWQKRHSYKVLNSLGLQGQRGEACENKLQSELRYEV